MEDLKKKCSSCKRVKQISEFVRLSPRLHIDREYKKCNKCSEINKKYREENKDKIIKYREENKEKLRETYKNYNRNNKEKIKIKNKNYKEKHKERLLEYQKEYAKQNREKINERTRRYRKENREKILERQRKYNVKNKERLQLKRKQYLAKNKERIREWTRNYKKHKLKTDIPYKLKHYTSASIRIKLKSQGGIKTCPTWTRLPYSPEELKEHLEKQFEPWMNWDNYGLIQKGQRTWQIDHIIPQSKLLFDSFDHPNFLKCWSLDNLRPLCSHKNNKKKDQLEYNISPNFRYRRQKTSFKHQFKYRRQNQ